MTGETRVRVRYAETDQMGVVYHANYLVWFEVGRVELMRQLGLSYKRMEQETGTGIAVVEATCRYKAPARYDEELVVRTRIAAMRGRVIKFAYTIHRAGSGLEGEVLLTEGATVHVVVGKDMQGAVLPEEYASVLRAACVSG